MLITAAFTTEPDSLYINGNFIIKKVKIIRYWESIVELDGSVHQADRKVNDGHTIQEEIVIDRNELLAKKG